MQKKNNSFIFGLCLKKNFFVFNFYFIFFILFYFLKYGINIIGGPVFFREKNVFSKKKNVFFFRIASLAVAFFSFIFVCMEKNFNAFVHDVHTIFLSSLGLIFPSSSDGCREGWLAGFLLAHQFSHSLCGLCFCPRVPLLSRQWGVGNHFFKCFPDYRGSLECHITRGAPERNYQLHLCRNAALWHHHLAVW